MKRKILDIRWYASCVLFCQLPEPMRRHVERRRRALWWKISKLPRELGELLDARGAPIRLFRAIVWAQSADEKRARTVFAIQHLAETGHWPTARTISEGCAPEPLGA